MTRLVYGVGINDAGYVINKTEIAGCVDGKRKRRTSWGCPFYRVWTDMLRRGYSDKYKATHPTYRGVTVCKEWHTFSVFKAWMETQDFEGKQLDKDLLIRGNKVYSPEACVFVSRQVNNFLIDRGNARGAYKVGVCWHNRVGKYKAQCCNPITKKGENLGLFTTEQEAHDVWLTKKLEHAHNLATLQTDERVAKALVGRYTNYKEKQLEE